MSDESPIIFQEQSGVLFATLNRPSRLNALNRETMEQLTAALKKCRQRLFVLQGAGDAFCAGADLKDTSWATNDAAPALMIGLLDALGEASFITMAVVHGHALGAGSGIAAACDMCWACEDAWLGFPEVRLGLMPAILSPYVIRAVGPRSALELMATGVKISGLEAARRGLVGRTFASRAPLQEALDAYSQEILKAAPGAIADIKALVRELSTTVTPDPHRYAIPALNARLASGEVRAGLSAFREKRDPPWHV